jgi:hypothetical protein
MGREGILDREGVLVLVIDLMGREGILVRVSLDRGVLVLVTGMGQEGIQEMRILVLVTGMGQEGILDKDAQEITEKGQGLIRLLLFFLLFS